MRPAPAPDAPPIAYARGSSCYCTFIVFVCATLVAIPLCINYSSGGVYWDVIAVIALGCLFWSALMIGMYLRTSGDAHEAPEYV